MHFDLSFSPTHYFLSSSVHVSSLLPEFRISAQIDCCYCSCLLKRIWPAAVMTDRTPPESHLQLEWVYGYRGHQCRNNIYYTATREVVYFVAGVGVVCTPGDEKQQRFFLGHSDDIISLALHPDKALIATGQIGKDPFVCVWDSESLDTVSILQGGHERGIAALGFSGDGKFLASVGLDDYHTLNVWDWRKGKILSSTRGHSDRIFDVQFNPFMPQCLVTCGVKHIKFWTLCGNTLTGKKGIFGKAGELQSILCAKFASEELVYTGTLSGDVYKWKGHSLLSVIKRAHLGAIYTLDSCDDGFATGSKDGIVKLWDKDFKIVTQLDLAEATTGYKGLVIRSVCWQGEKVLAGTKDSEVYEISVKDRSNPKIIVGGHAEGELWALATHPRGHMFATGSDDKSIRIWEMSDRTLVTHCSTPHPVRSLAYSPDGSCLAAGMQDGSFTVYSADDLSKQTHVKKRKEVLHEMKYSPNGQFLAVGSNDNFVDIYSVSEGYKHVGTCTGSSSFITHLDWSVDCKYLQTNSGASERLYYQMPGCKRVTAKEEIRTIHWATWTGVLGQEVNGIWPKYTQVNDINATDASFDHQVIVTGDDFGLVKLLRFPSIKKGAKFKKYLGHSAHVTNVRFTYNQSHVISVGGADNAIFQWKFIPPGGGVADSEDESVISQLGAGSETEGSDSELSDVGSLDSDLQREEEMTYDRTVFREDLQLIKKAVKKEKEGENKSGRGTKTASEGRKSRPPENSLILSFVHGYRGYDCRNNLFYTKEGELVYHVAAVGVVYNKESHKQRFYTSHTDDILCLSMHPSEDYIATGQVGRDPAIHIWNATSLDTLSILKGEHERGVCAVSFSPDGKRLASVGLDNDHSIVVWSWKKGEKLATTRGHKDKIFGISWNPYSGDQLVTVGVKHIKFWSAVGGGFTSKRGVFGKKGKPTTMLCVEYGAEGVCFTGGADGHIYHWNGSTLTKTVEGHKGPVFAMQRVEKGFISGGKDGIICLWDEKFTNCLKTYQLHSSAIESGCGKLFQDTPPIRALSLGQGKILVGTKNSEILELDRSGPIHILIQGHMEGEAWGLATHPTKNMCVTVSDDGSVRVWDMSTNKMVAVRSLGRAARSVGYSHDGGTLAVGMKDGSCMVLDAESLNDTVSFHHRKEEISDVKFSPNGKYLAVASHDNFVDIYSTAGQKRVGICKGASSYLTHLDWDDRGKLLQVNTGDSEVLYYEAPRGKQQLISKDDAEEIVWSSWTCVLGESCRGVWPAYTDVTDVNAACVSHDGHVIATGDDFGYVKLFKYPSYEKHAKCKQYVGHSAHVTNVRFSHDDRSLVSLGGADTSVMVWRYTGSHDQESDQSGGSIPTSGYLSDDSDTDSEEEGGFDSDVEREKKVDYVTKTYSASTRDPTLVKPHKQQSSEGVGGATGGKRGVVSRSVTAAPKVVTKEEKVKVTDLSLDYIFGYRGFDTRQNVWVTPDGCILYHAAAAGVVYNPLARTQSFYLEHTDDIVCLSLCRNSKLGQVVATGQIGKTAPVHVWDSHSKQTLSILQGAHGVGVCSVDFSCNGKLLLTVGLDQDHSVTVWRWSEGTRVAKVAGDQRRIFIAQFRPDSNNKFVSCGVKHVQFWTLAGTQLISKKAVVPKIVGGANMQTMLSLAFASGDVTFTGSISGDVFVWKDNVLTRLVSQAHSGPIFAMYTCLEDGLIVSAGKERGEESGVKLWDVDMNRSRTFTLGSHGRVVRAVSRSKGKILVGTRNSEVLEVDEKTGSAQVLVQGHGEGELWGLAAHPSSQVFATASDDKTVRIWDIKTKSLLSQRDLGQSARSADFSPDGRQLVVGQTNGEFVILSSEDLTTLAKKRDRSKTLQVVRYSPDGSQIAVGSDDACVDIYSTDGLARVGYCRGIPSFVTHIDWSQDGKYLQVSTGAYEKIVFQTSSGKHITDTNLIGKIVWASWTSVLGEEVVGIWPKSADKGDVNTAHLNPSGTAVATGDDFGCVKLFDHFPIPEKFTPHKKYYGHSDNVTAVRFVHDDSYLLSAGGDDSCVFVWQCHTSDK